MDLTALTFNAKTKQCVGYWNFYGLLDSSDITVSLIKEYFNETQECVIPEAYLREQISCHPGWLKAELNSSVFCYMTVNETTQKDFDLQKLPTLCQAYFPDAQAASIHTKDEEMFIVNNFKTLRGIGYQGVRLGLKLSDLSKYVEPSAWLWMDGTPMDYTNFRIDDTWMSETCGKHNKCAHGALFWTDDGKVKTT
ncbi:hypothetical protein L596_017768 [Steinernema carpocapsae]|uniref:C-type lectin domain-containing protein n=1 Tax=Steinernema carpocapsae TaxID=34508 RepID=A0A4U5N2Y2_STECR|nr:hypothetical protein L596_017768 [Steinernema carpocapsae]